MRHVYIWTFENATLMAAGFNPQDAIQSLKVKARELGLDINVYESQLISENSVREEMDTFAFLDIE